MQIISAPSASAFSMKASAGTSTPTSKTSNPAPFNIMATRFFPISWRSPLTVPMTTRPTGSFPISISFGSRILSPAFKALAATSTSGTKTSFLLNFPPITDIPSKSPVFKIVFGSSPSSNACCTSCLTFFALPFCKNSEISCNSSIQIPPVLFLKMIPCR